MIIGPANDKRKRKFDHMVFVQDTALRAIQPGMLCAEVDKLVGAYYAKHDLMDYWKRYVGHVIWIRYHEGHFLDIGDETIIQPGMVFTVEPGLYALSLGGFRHSDTALVTENGVEMLTYLPQDLDSLTI